MEHSLAHISRAEITDGFSEGYYCCMSGICKRQFKCDMWTTIFDEIRSMGLLARLKENNGIIGQTIYMPKKYARRIGLPTGPNTSNDDSTLVISCLNVHESHRNKGIATEMISETITFSKSQGYKRIEACIDPRPPTESAIWVTSYSPFKKFNFNIDESRTAWESKPDSRMCYLEL